MDIHSAADIPWRELGECIRGGKLVIYPTETSYALGCDATHPVAVQELGKLKQRDPAKYYPIIVDSLAMLESLGAHITDIHRKCAGAFWPGPLTMLFKVTTKLPGTVMNERGEVAARISSHPWARRLVEVASTPLIATSANISSLPPAVTIDQASRYFVDGTCMQLDAGALNGGASTIIVVKEDAGAVRILREGLIDREALEHIVPVLP